jgi:hypothetical protein
MDRAAGAGPTPSRSRSDTDVRGSGQVVNPHLAMYDNLRQRPSRCEQGGSKSWDNSHRRSLYGLPNVRVGVVEATGACLVQSARE